MEEMYSVPIRGFACNNNNNKMVIMNEWALYNIKNNQLYNNIQYCNMQQHPPHTKMTLMTPVYKCWYCIHTLRENRLNLYIRPISKWVSQRGISTLEGVFIYFVHRTIHIYILQPPPSYSTCLLYGICAIIFTYWEIKRLIVSSYKRLTTL